MTLKLIAATAVAFIPPLLAQTATPAPGANALILGSWKSQVEFDAVKITCGKETVLNDSFDRQQSGWKPESGNWQIANGVLIQSSAATPALTRYAFTCTSPDYTVDVRVRKTGGAEGFLIGFGAKDERNFYWLNLGGWNNTAHCLEKTDDGQRHPIGTSSKGNLEKDRWYNVRIEVNGKQIKCFLDDKQIIETTDSGFTLPPDNDLVNFGHALIPDMVADPSISEIDGTFYLYATTDGWGKGLSTSGMPVVWTSKDFLNWSFEGSSFPPDFDLKYWAPSTIMHRNGRYYSFTTLDGIITVVVADSPLGPFVAPNGQHVTKATIQPYQIEQKSSIDAEVFTDDDGQSYMFWSRRRAVKLKPDLLSPDGPMITIPTSRQGYSEGPFLVKRNGIYYYFYTLGGGESYQYAYMMSRKSPIGPWEAPKDDIIATSDLDQKVFGPGHGCFFSPKDSNQWYFVYLEYGRGGTNRQIYVDKMNFNPDGTIQPIKLTKTGVGALRQLVDPLPNLALKRPVASSSVLPKSRVDLRKDQNLYRIEAHTSENATDGANGTRWMAATNDTAPWLCIDLGEVRDISRTETYFVKPAAGHAYKIEWSLDGKSWHPYGGHDDVIFRSPHVDRKSIRARYMKLTILNGERGVWEFRIY